MKKRDINRYLGSGIAVLALIVGLISSGKTVETVIKGGRMEILDQGDKVVFTKDVKLFRGADSLFADKMVTDDNRDKIRVYGDVRFERHYENGERLLGNGAEGFYDTKSGTGYLLGGGKQARLIYTQVLSSTVTRKTDIFAERVDLMGSGERSTAEGRVYGKTVDPESGDVYEMWSDKAEYDRQKGTITLTGDAQPLVKQMKDKEEKRIQGDVITYFLNTRKFISEGKSKAVFFDPGQWRK